MAARKPSLETFWICSCSRSYFSFPWMHACMHLFIELMNQHTFDSLLSQYRFCVAGVGLGTAYAVQTKGTKGYGLYVREDFCLGYLPSPQTQTRHVRHGALWEYRLTFQFFVSGIFILTDSQWYLVELQAVRPISCMVTQCRASQSANAIKGHRLPNQRSMAMIRKTYSSNSQVNTVLYPWWQELQQLLEQQVPEGLLYLVLLLEANWSRKIKKSS